MKALLRKIYLATPTGMRKTLAGVLPIERVRRRYFESDSSLHDQYYTDHYFETDVIATAEQSAPKLCRALIERFRPADVIDVGCGTGEYLASFRAAGIEGHGIELAAAALKRCREKGLDVARIDLTTVRELPWKADLVYSFEVAEHIPDSAASAFVATIAASARKHVVITAASPGQPGLCHVNCQPKAYWIELFRTHGFEFDEPTTTLWQDENKADDLVFWFCENLLVFHAAGTGSMTAAS